MIMYDRFTKEGIRIFYLDLYCAMVTIDYYTIRIMG